MSEFLNARDKVQSVFLAFCVEDVALLDEVKRRLEEKEIKTHDYRENKAGSYLIDNMIGNLHKCDRFIALITPKFLKSDWCLYELLLALEMSQKKGSLLAVFLLQDVTKAQLPEIDLFQEMPQIRLRYEEDGKNLREDNVQEIVEFIKNNKLVRSVLPAGNLAHGQAWSHYLGLLQDLLPAFEKRIKRNDFFQTGRMPSKIYEMIPLSGKIKFDLEDNRLKRVGKLEVLEVERAGNPRIIEPSIYKITDENGLDYYAVVDMPSTLGIIRKMLATDLTSMIEDDCRLQISRFYFTLNMILGNSVIKDKGAKFARVIKYNDSKENLGDVLLKAIKEDLRDDCSTASETTIPKQEETSCELRRQNSFSNDVAIIFSEDDTSEDDTNACVASQVGNEICSYLEEQRITVHINIPGMARQEFHQIIKECRWIILVLTQNSLAESVFKFILNTFQTSQIHNRQINILPVLTKDVKYEHLPDSLRWIHYVTTEDVKYLEKIKHAVLESNVRLDVNTQVPVVDVAYGLAWGYVLNFLNLIIPDFINEMQDVFKKENIEEPKCPRKIYLIIPKSLKAQGFLDTFDGITKLKTSGSINKNNRNYQFPVYQLDYKKQIYHFIAIYPAPILTLWNMQILKIAGIKHSELYKEAEKFVTFTREILNGPFGRTSKNCATFIEFDDSDSTNLAEKLHPEIVGDLVQNCFQHFELI